MKKLFFVSALYLALTVSLMAQKKLPEVSVESLSGVSFKASEFTNNGKPMIVSFWATWCKPCLMEMETISEEFEDLQNETGVRFIAISIDDERSIATVRTLSAGKGWPFEFFLDKNQNLKRALNVVNIPHMLLLNGKGEIVWQSTSYAPGDEEELYDKVNELVIE